MERAQRKERIGVVLSDKMDKTVVVKLERKVKHPKYKKIIMKSKRTKVHDENNECKIGDLVRIMESRPLSKDKKWRVVKILERSEENK